MDDGQDAAQYSSGALEHTILAALQRMGEDLDTLSVVDLAPIDQFHFGGRAATLDLARLAGIRSGMAVLDIGGGLGGAARTLAGEFGCRVTVLDLTEEFCRVGEMLTERVGLGERVTFRQGDALDMPCDDESCDAVWTEHSTMNIEDKDRLFREIHRVLRPGGVYALNEVMAGPVQPPYFPTPWARDPALSFLARPEEVQRLLISLGFRQIVWRDTTAAVPTVSTSPSSSEPSSPLGLHLLTEDMPERLKNSARNRLEGRTVVCQAVYERV
jgi:ubiquinone/menaquinone biosynthesis C-methylase UbiE